MKLIENMNDIKLLNLLFLYYIHIKFTFKDNMCREIKYLIWTKEVDISTTKPNSFIIVLFVSFYGWKKRFGNQ